MNKYTLTIAIVLLTIGQSFAHYLWIETNPVGHIGKEQEIRVYFGEYTHGLIEKVEGTPFTNVKDFTLWAVDALGNETQLDVVPMEDYYLATYTPVNQGTHTVLLNNDNIDVIDYTQYDFGIFKTHYHSVAKIQIGDIVNSTFAANQKGITVRNLSENADKAKLQILYKNEALPEHEVNVYVADQWSKTLETDKEGYVSFDLPWDTKYIVEVTIKEEKPGSYKGKSYEFIWHCITHTLTK